MCVLKPGGSERDPPGASEGPFFRAFSNQDENKVAWFFQSWFWCHFWKLFCDIFWKFGDTQILRSILLRLKRIVILKFQVFFRTGPCFEKVCFSDFEGAEKRSVRSPQKSSEAPLSIGGVSKNTCFLLFVCVFFIDDK